MDGLLASSATQSLQSWIGILNRSAARLTAVVAATANDPSVPSNGGAALVDAMIGMNLAAAGVKANVSVARTADEMLGSLLDMHA
jgi:hypothetical protein